jgi:hypothetical protein
MNEIAAKVGQRICFFRCGSPGALWAGLPKPGSVKLDSGEGVFILSHPYPGLLPGEKKEIK